uniref:Uncharacterized protein n=1 Tax=Arundo donax TaxID=35708 RepID=A0A0A9FPW1_ARUDO
MKSERSCAALKSRSLYHLLLLHGIGHLIDPSLLSVVLQVSIFVSALRPCSLFISSAASFPCHTTPDEGLAELIKCSIPMTETGIKLLEIRPPLKRRRRKRDVDN